MTNTINGLRKSFKQEDTSLEKYRLAVLGTGADEVVAGTGATAPIIGATDESANATAGDPVWVIITWIVKVTILAATTKGARITATTAWKGASTAVDTNEYAWVLLETTTEANQVAQVQLNPARYAG